MTSNEHEILTLRNACLELCIVTAVKRPTTLKHYVAVKTTDEGRVFQSNFMYMVCFKSQILFQIPFVSQ